MRKGAGILLSVLVLALQSCFFTGVESTPKINAGELKRQHVSVTPEQQFMAELAPDRPAHWQRGKHFYVSDNRIQLIFTTSSTGTDSLAGQVIEFCRIDSVPAVDSHAAAEIVLTHQGDTLRYRPGMDYAELMGRQRYDIPFTIDLDLVGKVRSLMAGNRYWITAPRWYDPATGEPVHGTRRYVPVRVTDVLPGRPEQPLMVVFKADDDSRAQPRAVFMTVGDDRLAIRNFDKLFSFTDVRSRYPMITDQMWELITRSELAAGMTRDECRLAIGAPLQITQGYGSMATLERWTYADGVYLIFDDGILSKFRR